MLVRVVEDIGGLKVYRPLESLLPNYEAHSTEDTPEEEEKIFDKKHCSSCSSGRKVSKMSLGS